MKKLLLIYLTLILFSTHSALGNKLYCRNYNLNNGLPNNTINDIYKDSRGFLWIGTNAGLTRFDGINFKIYTSLNGLAGDHIVSICENNKGEIWLGCKNNGITSIYGNKIINITKETGLISNKITKLYFSKKYNLIFIGTEEGLSVFNDGKIINIHKVISNEDYKLHITDFFETEEYIYVFTKGGKVFKYNPFLERLTTIISSSIFNQPKFSSAFISSNNDTILNYQNILHFINQNHFPEIGLITDYKEDLNGTIWIASIKNTHKNSPGIYQYYQGKIERYNDLLEIKEDDILCLEFDQHENILWIGTRHHGLYLLPANSMVYYSASDFKLNNLHIIDLYSDKNNLWICTNESLIQKKSDDNSKTYSYEMFKNAYNQFANYKLKHKYQYLQDKNGSYKKYENLILKGIYHFSNPYVRIENEKTITLEDNSLYKPFKYDVITSKKFKSLNGIIGIKNDHIWIGSNVGIFKLNKKTQQLDFYDVDGVNFSRYYFDDNFKLIANSKDELLIYQNIENKNIFEKYNFYTDNSPTNTNKIISANNLIWFSSSDHGLYVLKDNKFISSYNQKLLNTSEFNDICVDHYNNIIAAGNNGSIYIVELKNDTIISKFNICAKSGIKGTTIRWLYPTNDNKLLIGTNAGINVLDLKSLYNSGIIDLQYINKNIGLTDYSGVVATRDSFNNLWIGTNSQLIKQDANNRIYKKDVPINYYIESVTVNNEDLEIQNYSDVNQWDMIPTKPIILSHKKNNISFFFKMIHFLDPNSIFSSYKLEGFMDTWSKPSNNHTLTFQNLPSGKYILRVKLFHNTILESSQELSINFTIKRPYWEKLYFNIIAIILLAALVWSIVRIRSNSIRKKERIRSEIAERITEFEMKAMRAQMNPHFIFNVINSIQNYMLDNDVDAALNYLSDFAKIIRITLDNVSKKKVDLEDELNYLKYYLNLEKMRFDKNFETEIILPKEVHSRKIMVPPMIIQPYIENAIKYGFIYKVNNAKIKLEFHVSDDEILHCIIEDNGIGRKKSRELSQKSKTSKSKASYITYERLTLLNQTEEKKGYKVETIDLYDQYDLPSGTRVLIDIPL